MRKRFKEVRHWFLWWGRQWLLFLSPVNDHWETDGLLSTSTWSSFTPRLPNPTCPHVHLIYYGQKYFALFTVSVQHVTSLHSFISLHYTITLFADQCRQHLLQVITLGGKKIKNALGSKLVWSTLVNAR